MSHRHGYGTLADFVRGRHGSRGLSLAVAVTGFIATMPYIALQLVGIQAVLEVAGIGGSGNWLAKDVPPFVAPSSSRSTPTPQNCGPRRSLLSSRTSSSTSSSSSR
ncbi:MAG TPA: hypothetical protein VGD71_07070 [Kribbella sp.]